ncbi:MAG: glycosyltransferase family 2 protein [Bacteroidia bacterium]|nr:glycosyltransferase family 2 protein [Bacteroidia bacterium]
MPKISAVIITFNEERNIARCLDSLQGVADEVLVVDSYSTDNTKQIALQKGARFIEHGFDGHIEQKNWALSQAKFPHVLSLDADEALSPKLKESILEVKSNWQFDAYSMNRLTNYCGHWIRHSGWYPDTKARLWDSRKGKWGGDNPHDKFELFETNKPIGFLQGDLLHYSYYSRSEHINRTIHYGKIGAEALKKRKAKGLLIKQLINPPWKFFKIFVLNLGFLDGSDGLFIARQAFHETWLKYHLALKK